MTTFDEILPRLTSIFQDHRTAIERIAPILVNRDLNARVRLIVAEKWEQDRNALNLLNTLTSAMHEQLGSHAYPVNAAILYEADIEAVIQQAGFSAALADIAGVRVIDRLVTEGNWSTIAPVSSNATRIVFFSIKGGVGRSTALAATAWSLAQSGKRVLVLDLDLESPGLSSSLLPDERRPKFGLTDWLVEDLTDNGDAVFSAMIASSNLSNRDIVVVPAHGANTGEYISKLGRVWMSRREKTGGRESWPQRLQRLLNKLETELKPDVILIDSRAGIDEVASACVTDLGAVLVLLFALEGEQTWSGYRILFQHWRNTGVIDEIRQRLKLVGALIPEPGAPEYFSSLQENAWNLFSEDLYDKVATGHIVSKNFWNFDELDEGAPHRPWPIRWNRGFAGVYSLYSRLQEIDAKEVESVFGDFISGIQATLKTGKQNGD